jgi:hypothetical protein
LLAYLGGTVTQRCVMSYLFIILSKNSFINKWILIQCISFKICVNIYILFIIKIIILFYMVFIKANAFTSKLIGILVSSKHSVNKDHHYNIYFLNVWFYAKLYIRSWDVNNKYKYKHMLVFDIIQQNIQV